ncbi:MAG: TolC family protein [Gammaproteobacteria bacterium]|jgi:outer membrane protein TolC|nr:TolC family protein [Candidatus Neomarinimicrobiota bacterium]MBT4330378.1 TolC family protein [Gammaproteobacteria bacterium]MBT5634874.1 TolC family protein [Gammaproteobacteria bacterium]
MIQYSRVLLAGLFSAVVSTELVAVEVDAASSVSVVPADHVGESLVTYLRSFISDLQQSGDQAAVQSLAKQVVDASRNHPEYDAAQAKMDFSQEAENEAFAAYFPKIYGNSSSGYNREDGVAKNETKLGVGLNQLLYDFGATASRVDAAKSDAEVSSAELKAKGNELIYRGVKAWHELFRTQRMVELHRLNVESRREIVDFVAQRAALGGSSQSDVLRARARWADAEAGVAKAESQVERAKASWIEIISTEAPIDVEINRFVGIDHSRYVDLSQVAHRYATVERAYAKHQVASDRASAAAADKFPRLELDLSVSKLMDDPDDLPQDRSAQIQVRYDFYTGGAKKARASQARAQAAQAASDAETELRQAEKLLRQALADVEAGGRTVTARREAASIAAASMKAVREQFAYRRGTLLDLLRVQEDLFFAGRNLIDAMADSALAHYRFLYLASDLESYLEQ